MEKELTFMQMEIVIMVIGWVIRNMAKELMSMLLQEKNMKVSGKMVINMDMEFSLTKSEHMMVNLSII